MAANDSQLSLQLIPRPRALLLFDYLYVVCSPPISLVFSSIVSSYFSLNVSWTSIAREIDKVKFPMQAFWPQNLVALRIS